jgi:WXXGXW repeat (2 copies)
MSERYRFGIGRFSHSPSDAELRSTEFDHAAVSVNLLAAAKNRIRRMKFNRLGLRAARLAACCAVGLLLAVSMLAAPAKSSATAAGQVAFSISVVYGPPPLPIYVQPLCPGPGYIWAPGYWAWDPVVGYYWVPGTWVFAPFPGALWTPGYWAWYEPDDDFVWYPGYWGPVVGFYGGIVYGFGYTGYGYDGGYWQNNVFYYNRAVNNVNVQNITNVYYRQVNVKNVTYVSYNGGSGGVQTQPTREQLAAVRERRSGAVGAQRQQEQLARRDPSQRASVNRGLPPVAATARAGAFMSAGTVRATRAGGTYKEPPARGAATRGRAQPRPNEARPPAARESNQPASRPSERRPSEPSRNEARPPAAREPRQPASRPSERRPSQPSRNEARRPQGSVQHAPVNRPSQGPPPQPRQRETAPPNAGRRSPPPQAEPGGRGTQEHPPRGHEGTKDNGNPHGGHR